MQVFVDDKKVFDSGVLKETTPAVPVKIDLEGADEMRLVVTDAGDGITCDAANWADARLIGNPAAKVRAPGNEVNLAAFATVRTWDPARMEGTTASRLEPIPAHDLFLGAPVLPETDGTYTVPKAADGRSCIGIEWLERRRIERLELQFAEGSVVPKDAEVQYWRMGYRERLEGGSRWQGQWLPMAGEVAQEGNRWVMYPDWTDKPEHRVGALKVRWIFPPSAEPVRIGDIRAFTPSRFALADITLYVEEALEDAVGTVEIYNGSFEGTDGIQKSWKLNEPLSLKVRYAPRRPWQLTDRTVLRLTLPGTSFGVAVDDVVDDGPVYVAHAGLMVSTESQEHKPEEYRRTNVGKKKVLEKVRSLPDQTSTQAMEHVPFPEASLGPTMLSLACDNRKFVVERNGNISFDNDPAVYDSVSGLPRQYSCELVVGFGSDKPQEITRHYARNWFPIVVIERTADGIALRQRTFVAPLDDHKAGVPPWHREHALCVTEYTVLKENSGPANASLTLKVSARYPEGAPTTVRVEGRRAYIEKDGELLALVEAVQDDLTLSAEGNVIRVEGVLRAGARARCVAYLPSWNDVKADDLPASDATDDLVRKTEDYWSTVTAEGMQVEVPDPLINNLIPASVMHCMMAARNDQGRTIAPWIASISYGPWESEAQSVIRGMYAMGQMDFARRALEYFVERYNDEGFLTTGYTLMGTGWHLWALGEYYTLTRDKGWMQHVAPEVERVCRWVMAQREKTKMLDAHGEKVPEYGLMPPGVMADWNAFNYYFYMNGYYYAGLEAVGAALVDIGWPGAHEILENAAEYRDEILRAYAWVQARAPVVKLRDGTWTPFYPTHVYSPSPIENFYAGEDQGRSWCYDIELGAHHLIPLGVLDPMSPQADYIINHMEDVQFFRSGWFQYSDEEANKADWFNLGGFSKVQPYYARTGEVHAMRDDVKPFIRTYFNSLMSLLNRENLSLWEHFVAGAFNKTHETGYYLHQTRLMFVQERGDELWLAPFVTSNWLHDGMRVAARQAPTTFGPVAYAITSHVTEGHIDATIEPPTRTVPKAVIIRLRHPQSKVIQSAHVVGAKEYAIETARECIRIVPAGGSVTVRANY